MPILYVVLLVHVTIQLATMVKARRISPLVSRDPFIADFLHKTSKIHRKTL